MAALNFPSSPANGDVYHGYVYNAAKDVWTLVPQMLPNTLDNVADVDIDPAVADNHALLYNATSENWESSAIPASAITSGTFDIGRIPTGITSSTVSLGNHTHTAGDLPNLESLNGTLDIANGGTGASTVAAAREALGVGLVPVVPSSVVIATGSGSANALGQVSFTGATAVSLNGVFSSTYRNYKVLLHLSNATANSGLYFRYRVSGADNSSNNYYQGGQIYRAGNTVGNNGYNPIAMHSILDVGAGATYGGVSLDVLGPASGVKPVLFSSGLGANSGNVSGFTAFGMFDAGTVFDGFTLYLGTGNISGTVQVLAYND